MLLLFLALPFDELLLFLLCEEEEDAGSAEATILFTAVAATVLAALSNRREVLKAGEKTSDVNIVATCSSKTQRGEPSEILFVQSVSNKQRSLILFSFQEVVDEMFVAGTFFIV